MSPDELFALVISGVLSLVFWSSLLLLFLRLAKFSPGLSVELLACGLSLPVSGGLLFALLANFASHDVRDSGVYLAFYMVMGAALVQVGLLLLDKLGLSLRDDVVERRNPAAALAFAGVVPGLTLAFAGANIGDGPGWWVVVFCAGLAMGGLLVGWLLLDRITQIGETVVVERNRAAGLRVGAWFVATGAILGRAAAGDWVSVDATLHDFSKTGAGALGLLGLTLGLELWVRPRTDKPRDQLFLHGAIPALVLLCLAALYLNHYGRW